MNGERFEQRPGEASRAAAILVAVGAAAVVMTASVAVSAQTSPGEPGGEKASVDGQRSETENSLDQAGVRQQVVELLSGYHFTPSRDRLDEVAEPGSIAAALRSIASDTSMRPSLRGRAVDLLALYEDDKTVAFLEQLLAPPGEDVPEKQRRVAIDLRHRAVLSYAENRSASQAVERLSPLLETGGRQLQLTVIAALGKHTGETGKKKLMALAQTIEDDIVRDELAKYVELDSISTSAE